jgi:hypothetical protein
MKKLVVKRDALLKKLVQRSSLLKGSISCVCARCNRANCICTQKGHPKAYRLTYKNPQQKTQIVYIPENRLPEIREMIANYATFRKITDQLIGVNLEIFKANGSSKKL